MTAPVNAPTRPAEPSRRRRRRRWPWVCVLLVVVVVLAVVVGGRLEPHLRAESASAGRDDAGADPHDDSAPAVGRLDPDLRAALRAATDAAAADGVEVVVTSGWRSRAHQQELLDEAVERYGSYEEARRWVNTPDGSTHVTGEAVDVGPTEAAYWFAQHGAEFGLCQVYANEIWHYELLTAPGGSCPELLPDSSGSS